MILLAVSLVVIWLRFRLSEVLPAAIWAGIGLTLREHGTKRLFNGADARPQMAPVKNRAYRRAERARRRH